MKLIFFEILFIVSIWANSIQKENNTTKSKEKNFSFLVVTAKKYLGKPYSYGKIGPKSFDCSGFVYAICRENNITVPRTSLKQSQIKGKKIPKEQLVVGDLIFFDTSKKGKVNHSGIFLGDDKFIHASSGKAYSVTISNLSGWYRDKFKWGKRIDADK